MSLSQDELQAAIERELASRGMDVVEMVSVPATQDRMVRMRTLEEILRDFDREGDGSATSYVIQVRPRGERREEEPVFERAEPREEPSAGMLPLRRTGGIYRQDGSLDIAALERYGSILLNAGDPALASNVYKALLQSGQRTAPAYLGLGKCKLMENDLAGAKSDFEESIAYCASAEGYQQLAAVLIRLKKDQYAAEVIERCLKLDGIEDSVRFDLHKACGNAWMRSGNGEGAEAHYRKALSLEPGADEIRSNLGSLYLQNGRVEEARRCFQDAISSNPRNDRAHVGMGSCMMAEGKIRAAHDHFVRALEIEIQNPTAIFYLIKCAYEGRNYTTAARIVADYVERSPVNPNLLFSLGGLYFHLGKYREARVTAKKILSIRPDHAGAKELLKKISRNNGAR